MSDHETNISAPISPARIVSLAPAASELICIFGGIDRIVGRDDHSTFPPTLNDKPALGSSIKKTINVELVLDLHPDVVVTGGHISPKILEKIRSSGTPVVSVGTSCELESLIKNILILSEMMGAEKTADELIEFLKGYANLIRKRTNGLDPKDRPRVYHECAFSRYKTTATCTSANECIDLAGGANIAKDEPPGKSVVSGKWVDANNPDIIISQVSTKSPATVKTLSDKRDEILSRQELKDTNAVRDGRVYVSHLSVRRGPRLVGYLLYLAKWFHPELFEDIDPAAVKRDLLQKFYGLDVDGTWAYPEM